MIRRGWPLGTAEPERWVLLTQPEHARLSWELAAAWGGPNVPPLVCPPDETDHPLAGVRRELLDAIRQHDDGWQDRLDAPRIDPQHDRPLGFTEMAPADAQRVWTDSIELCRAIGPLAGWVVASHFSALQSKRDEDYPEWIEWLRDVDARRAGWLTEWLAASEHHTQALADRYLAWLQAFDWISLWLCLHGPALDRDQPPPGPLAIGGDATGWPAIGFKPAGGRLEVSPWPFLETDCRLEALASSLTVRDPRTPVPVAVAWRLVPADLPETAAT